MKRGLILKNNRGGGLILVIGCVALLSLVGAMLLVVTNNNRKMKDLEMQMQQSFYGAESGSNELVSQLEIEAEDALKRAFADLMVQYSKLNTPDARNARFSEFFQTAFYDELTKDDGARKLMCVALGGDPDTADLNALDVQVSFGEVVTPVPYVAGSGEDSTQIRINDVTFTYALGGSRTSITTDIIVDAKIPDVEGNMANTIACDFTDFAVISGADVVTPLNTSQAVNVNGNFYTKNSLTHRSAGMNLTINNAKKFLVAEDLVVTNGAKLNIDTGSVAGGDGVWANNVVVSDRGELTAKSNFYVSDDLTMEQEGAKVTIEGNEYIGYSGYVGTATVDNSALNSAITINSAKNITLDLSQTHNLVLNGRSYIHDALWGSDALLGAGSDNALGVLQGESMAYKDMQSMYLVPSECLVINHNPMTLGEFNGLSGCLMTDAKISYKDAETGNTEYFSLREYLGKSEDSSDPNYALTENDYVVRHVKLDGGTTEFVYLYLNFATDQLAQKYFADYMAVPELAEPMKVRLKTLGNSTIKLADHNYTLANAFQYDYTVADSYGVQHATTDFTQLVNSSLLAKRRTSGLFTSFRLNSTSTETRNYDVIANKIVKMDKLQAVAPNTWMKKQYTIGTGTYDFWVHNGDVTLDTTIPSHSGIILVNGKLTFSGTAKTFNGLVLATGGIEFVSDTTLNSDKAAVEALLTESEVQEYLRATGGTGTPASPYLSSEAVSISFENWKKN